MIFGDCKRFSKEGFPCATSVLLSIKSRTLNERFTILMFKKRNQKNYSNGQIRYVSFKIKFRFVFFTSSLSLRQLKNNSPWAQTKLRRKKSPSLRSSAELSFKIRSKQETKEVHKAVWAFFPLRSFRWQVKALVQKVNKFSRLNGKKNMHVNAHITNLRKMYPQLQVIFTG